MIIEINIFLGAQEFFRDFVLCCNSFRFLAHLKNTLVAEILKQEAAVSNNQVCLNYTLILLICLRVRDNFYFPFLIILAPKPYKLFT